MATRDEVRDIVRAELAERPRRGGSRRLPRTWRGEVQISRRAASVLGIRSLSRFVDYVLANLGGGGGGGGVVPISDPTCPPCVVPANYSYDGDGRLEQISYGSPVAVITTISRDGAGRVTEMATSWSAGTRTNTFTYDAAGRRQTSSSTFTAA